MSENSQSTNKTIAKNAAALYFRMIIMMLVGLYTSRVILQALGVENFGIYNVVGGFVSMFSLVSSSITGSVSRYLTFELGKRDIEKLKQVFSTSIYVLLGLGLLIILLTETFGIWYLYNKMVIPPDRLEAAFWVFQLSLVTFLMTLINSPYQASIISHEDMGVYAYLSIFDAICKLIISFLVIVSPIDKLIFYATLLCLVSVIDQLFYVWYCKRKYEECRFAMVFNKALFKEMFGFAGWNFIGSSANILRSQGASLLLNAFGGPVVNAANGIANSISNIVANFVNNFTQAFNPQITKQYASGEYESLMRLLIYGSKYSYYLMFLLALPVFYNAQFIFEIWLGVVPEYTVEITRWTLIFLLAESISRPIITAKNATGNIRNYQLVVGGVLLLMLPISYLGLKLGMTVTFVAFSNALTAILAIFARMYMLRGDFPCWSTRLYFTKVFMNVIIVSVVACILPCISYYSLPYGLLNFLTTSCLCVTCSCLSIFYIGCTKRERELIMTQISKACISIKSKFHK